MVILSESGTKHKNGIIIIYCNEDCKPLASNLLATIVVLETLVTVIVKGSKHNVEGTRGGSLGTDFACRDNQPGLPMVGGPLRDYGCLRWN